MINHQKTTNRFLRFLIIVVCLALCILTLVACSHKSKDIENKSEKKVVVARLSKIAFEKDNNVYLYDEETAQIKSVGDSAKLKDLLQLSPDKTKLLFRIFNEGKAIYPQHIIIYDIKSKKLTDIPIKERNLQQIINLEWVDNENILVTGHINPSVSGYAVYNLKSKTAIMSCEGTLRDLTINNKSILYSSTPHIFPLPAANLYINNNKIYEANNVKEIVFDGVISKDGKMIAFRSYIPRDGNLKDAYLNVANVDSDGKSISGLNKIVISSDTTGNLQFDDKNNISIIGDESIYKLKDGVLIEEKNILVKQVEISEVKLKSFKQKLAIQFPDDFITDDTILDDVDVTNVVEF